MDRRRSSSPPESGLVSQNPCRRLMMQTRTSQCAIQEQWSPARPPLAGASGPGRMCPSPARGSALEIGAAQRSAVDRQGHDGRPPHPQDRPQVDIALPAVHPAQAPAVGMPDRSPSQKTPSPSQRPLVGFGALGRCLPRFPSSVCCRNLATASLSPSSHCPRPSPSRLAK